VYRGNQIIFHTENMVMNVNRSLEIKEFLEEPPIETLTEGTRLLAMNGSEVYSLEECTQRLHQVSRPVDITSYVLPNHVPQATEVFIEEPDTQDDRHMNTQVGMPAPVEIWSQQRSFGGSHTFFTVMFHTRHLGLKVSGALSGGQFAVQALMNEVFAEQLKRGDKLIAINAVRVGNISLAELQEQLDSIPRPIRVMFARPFVTTDDQTTRSRVS
jgi:PDZ domain-containing secreted protein